MWMWWGVRCGLRKPVGDRFYMGTGNRKPVGDRFYIGRMAAEKWQGQLAQWGCGFF